MPQDAKIGRDLASQLTASYGGLIKEVEYTYDPYLELPELETNRPFCKVSPQLYDETRESRVHWRETCQLMLTLVSRVGPTDSGEWVDEWLDSWDLIMRESRDMIMLGRYKVVSIDRDDRYDTDVFHHHHRLLTQAAFNFGNVR